MLSASEYLIDSFGNERRELADEKKQFLFPGKQIHPSKKAKNLLFVAFGFRIL